jgi:predicted RNA-binding protein with PUA-like domain
LPLLAKNITQMPDGVCQQKRFVLRAAERNGLAVMFGRLGAVSQIPFDLPQPAECLCKQNPVVGLLAPFDRRGKPFLGICQPILFPRLIAARDKFGRRDRFHAKGYHAADMLVGTPLEAPGYCSLFHGFSLTMELMSYFLFKTEPDVYSFDDFQRDKETVWDGVTNTTAVMHLREMKAGTKWIFYHTGDERTAVGTGTVTSVDPSDPKVPVVRVKVGKRLKTPKPLSVIKTEKLFAGSPLVKIGRLSVVPLSKEQWEWFLG